MNKIQKQRSTNIVEADNEWGERNMREEKWNTTAKQFADASPDKCQEFEEHVKASFTTSFVTTGFSAFILNL